MTKKVIEFASAKQKLIEKSQPIKTAVPTDEEILNFLKVCSYIRNMSSSQTGQIVLDSEELSVELEYYADLLEDNYTDTVSIYKKVSTFDFLPPGHPEKLTATEEVEGFREVLKNSQIEPELSTKTD